MLISGNQNFIPVVIGESQKTLEEIINTSTVINAKGKEINLAGFFTIEKEFGLKSIIAGEEGEYYPIALDVPGKEVVPLSKEIRSTLLEKGIFEAGFSGSWFSDREMIKSLSMILLISLLLLYFILASQFESLVLPLLVLMEVPIDIFGAFLLLKIFGGSINLMSLIGIVVMSGIIINDSILKVDTINQLHRSGTPLMKDMVLGGKRRLKPILMTSLTTVLALLPFNLLWI
jgi:multidrug efflux pump subunit AcrB